MTLDGSRSPATGTALADQAGYAPPVTVVVPTHARPRLMAEAVESEAADAFRTRDDAPSSGPVIDLLCIGADDHPSISDDVG